MLEKTNFVRDMRPRDLVDLTLEQVGYTDMKEMITSVFALKIKFVYLFGVTFGSIITVLHEITDKYIYTPAAGVLILWVVSLVDTILGSIRAVKEHSADKTKEGFSPVKFARAFIRVVIQTIFVAMLFNMGRTWGYIIASWMVDSLLIVFTLSTFFSAIQNAYYLGLVSKDQYEFISTVINPKKWMDKFKSKGDE